MKKNILFIFSVFFFLLLNSKLVYADMSIAFHDSNIYNYGKVIHKVVGNLYDDDRSSDLYCTESGAAFTGTVTGRAPGNTDKVVEIFETMNGRLNGKFTLYARYPNIKMQGYYKNGKKDGIWKFNYNSGEPENEKIYADGLIMHSKTYSPKGNVFEEMNFAAGVGTSGYVWINGRKYSLYFNNGEVVTPHGNILRDKNGQPAEGYLLMEDSYYYPLKNGVISGDAVLYDGESVLARIPFVNGIRDGVAVEYDSNAEVYKQTPYVNGKKEGAGREGNMIRTYKDDRLIETKIALSDDDKIIIRSDENEKPIEFKAVIDGKESRYSPSVEVVQVKGESLYFDTKDQTPYTGIFLINNEHIVNIVRGKKEGAGYIYSNGGIKIVESYKNGLQEGITVSYYDYKNKKIRGIVSYSNNQRNGEYKNYNIHGIMYEKGIYKDGKRVFVQKYNEDGSLKSISDSIGNTEKIYDRSGKLIKYSHKNEAGQWVTEEY